MATCIQMSVRQYSPCDAVHPVESLPLAADVRVLARLLIYIYIYICMYMYT